MWLEFVWKTGSAEGGEPCVTILHVTRSWQLHMRRLDVR